MNPLQQIKEIIETVDMAYVEGKQELTYKHSEIMDEGGWLYKMYQIVCDAVDESESVTSSDDSLEKVNSALETIIKEVREIANKHRILKDAR